MRPPRQCLGPAAIPPSLRLGSRPASQRGDLPDLEKGNRMKPSRFTGAAMAAGVLILFGCGQGERYAANTNDSQIKTTQTETASTQGAGTVAQGAVPPQAS